MYIRQSMTSGPNVNRRVRLRNLPIRSGEEKKAIVKLRHPPNPTRVAVNSVLPRLGSRFMAGERGAFKTIASGRGLE
jgi:hypothetical protein